MNQKLNIFLILLLFLIILIRIPTILSWNKYLTGNDAAIYMEESIHLAEGKGLTSSICRYMASWEDLTDYVGKFGTRTQEIKVAPLYIFMLSGIYRLVGEGSFMLWINLLNLMLFLATLLVMYYWICPRYGGNPRIWLLSIIFMGINYSIFEGAFGAHLESLSLFLFVCAYAYHIRIVNLEHVRWYDVLGYSLVLTLLFFSKYSVIPFIGAFLLHHLISKRYGFFVLVSGLMFLLISPWFILRDIQAQGGIIGSFTMTPYAGELPNISSLANIKVFAYRAYQVGIRFLKVLFDVNGLAFLLPFGAVYLVGHPADRQKQVNWLLIGVSAVFFAVYGYIDQRYIFPAFIPLIPAAFAGLYDLLEKYGDRARRIIVASLMIILVSLQLSQMAQFTLAVRKQAKDRKSIFLAADRLLNQAGVTNKDNILTNILGYNVYSDTGIALAPEGMTPDNKARLIELYDIDYVLFCANQIDSALPWDQNGVRDNIFTGLPLIGVSDKDSRVMLYRASPSVANKEDR
jgi:hypothetical protein